MPPKPIKEKSPAKAADSKHDSSSCVQQSSLLIELIAAFQDNAVIKSLREATKDKWLYEQVIGLNTKMAQVQAENVLLRHELDALKKTVSAQQIHADSLEQQSRKDSVRLFGIAEDAVTHDQERDAESLAYEVFTQIMGADITRDEMEVTHRVGPPPTAERKQAAAARGKPLAPRPILVKFLDRKSKAKVMAKGARSSLKNTGFFLSDDLTKQRSHLAFLARLCKREHLGIADTWITNSKVFVKTEAEGLVREVTCESDLPKIPPALLQRKPPGCGPPTGAGAQPAPVPVPPGAGGAYHQDNQVKHRDRQDHD